MRILQKFGFLDSNYERPNQNWVCGRAAVGDPCRIGPDGRGECQADFECSPRRDGDRWECTRPLIAGGECGAGPLPDGACCRTIPPCTPLRSQRAKRGMWVRWATAITIGFLAVILGFNSGALFTPGPMTNSHSSLTSCSDCHSSVAGGPFGWIHSVFTEIRPSEDNKACLTCHIAGKNAARPHGLSDGKMSKMGQMSAARPDAGRPPMTARVQQAMFPIKRVIENDIGCGTCHVEHKGRKSDLKIMSDAECQSCHTAQFTSFSSGHPEFSDYPFKRRTRIIYDHVSHSNLHYPKMRGKDKPVAKAPEICADCHELGPNRRLMAIKPFEESCSACHVDQITGAERMSGPRGVPFLTIPGLDVETLRERNAVIGEWPEDSDAELTPFMAMLLQGRALTKEHMAMIGKRDLLDLSDASDDDIAAVERLAWAIKSLIFDMSTKNPALLTQILSAGNQSGDIPVGRLIAAMPRDVMLGARRDWLPNLARELADHKAGKRVLASGAFVEKRSAKQLESAPSISDTAAAAAAKNDILSDTAVDKGKVDILSGDKSDILSGDKSDILSNGSDDVSSLQVDSPPPTAEPEVDEEKFARLGGWYRRDFGIFFHPTGHEDRFLISWLDYAGRNAGDDNAGEAVFKSLSGKNAQGGCVKCHSVDAIPGGGKQVNWAPSGVKPAKQRLTAFSHAPHFSVVGPKGCVACHQIDGKAKYQDNYSQPDAAQFASNFTSVPLATCSECHNPKFAGETCLTCHNYHAGMIETPFLTTRIPGQKP